MHGVWRYCSQSMINLADTDREGVIQLVVSSRDTLAHLPWNQWLQLSQLNTKWWSSCNLRQQLQVRKSLFTGWLIFLVGDEDWWALWVTSAGNMRGSLCDGAESICSGPRPQYSRRYAIDGSVRLLCAFLAISGENLPLALTIEFCNIITVNCIQSIEFIWLFSPSFTHVVRSWTTCILFCKCLHPDMTNALNCSR